MFLSSYRNTSGILGEREMLWEHEPQASVSTAFSSSPKLPHECFYNTIETRRAYFLFILENTAAKKNNFLTLIIIIKIIFVRAIIASTTSANSVLLSSYGNRLFNQSARVFSYDCFLNVFSTRSPILTDA